MNRDLKFIVHKPETRIGTGMLSLASRALSAGKSCRGFGVCALVAFAALGPKMVMALPCHPVFGKSKEKQTLADLTHALGLGGPQNEKHTQVLGFLSVWASSFANVPLLEPQ